MQDRIKTFEDLFDRDWFREHTLNLYRIERKQTFPAYHEGAKYIYDLLKKEGFEPEYLEFPADGKTCYQDKCIPIGWDVTDMRLEITSRVPGLKDRVIADYQREPLHAVKHSVSTPPEGLDVQIITESQMKLGADVTGALILLDHRTQPRCEAMRMLLDLGAIGWVTDYSENPQADPDTVFWANSATEYGMWHVHAEERDFIAFQVSERNGSLLRQACNNGTVKAHIYSDAKRYETVLPAVSALLPGEDPREIWVVAHTCEPLIDDDANGVIASIAMLKALRDMQEKGEIRLRYSVRVAFSSELYGLSAVCDHYGGDLSKKTIGGINMDGFTSSTDKSVFKEFHLYEAADLPGFAGNILFEKADAQFLENHPEYKTVWHDHNVGDDVFFNDTTIGMPTVWICHNAYGYHHNSAQDETIMDVDAAAENFGFAAQWVCAMATLTDAEVEQLLPATVKRANEILEAETGKKVRPGTDMQARMAYLYNREVNKIQNLTLWGDAQKIEQAALQVKPPENAGSYVEKQQETPWYDYAENFVFTRLMRGLPHDMLCIPKEQRTVGYGGMLYQPFSEVFLHFDGKRTLKEAICRAEWDKGIVYTEKEIKKWLHFCILFSQHGYLKMETKNPLTGAMLEEALKGLGVNAGETLLVHSGISNIGYLEGGAETMITALENVLGEDGTFLAPVFTDPYLMFDGDVNKGYSFRPYDRRKDGALRDKTVRTGLLGKAMLKKQDAFRSGHGTHEWVAMGKNAEEAVSGHGFLDAPTGETSPLKYALDKNGSVLFLGCDPGSNTFVHFVEIMAGIDFADPVVMQYIDENGRTITTMMDKHLYGCRTFYNGADDAFYVEAKRRGLHIYEHKFGLVTLYRIDLREVYDITMQMFREDPYATLCKKPDCPFCKKFVK